MTFENFNTNIVKIEQLGDEQIYGHHPMQMVVVNNDETISMIALAHLGVQDIVNIVKTHTARDAKEIFVSLDFPATGDIKNDFIISIHIENGVAKASRVIEYLTSTGEILKTSNGSEYEVALWITKYFL